MTSPDPAEIKRVRESLHLTRTAAAALVHCKILAWQRWESGQRKMHPAMWELFLLKTGK